MSKYSSKLVILTVLTLVTGPTGVTEISMFRASSKRSSKPMAGKVFLVKRLN